MDFKLVYTQLEELMKDNNIPSLLKELGKLTLEDQDIFIRAFTMYDVKDTYSLEKCENLFCFVVSHENYVLFSNENKETLLLLLSQIVSTTPNNLSTKNLNLNIDESHLLEATNMITNSLGIKNGSMNNLINDMVGNIGTSINSGMCISDIITNLSKDFGTKLNENIQSGNITK